MKTFRDLLKIIVIPLIILVIPYIFISIPAFYGYIPFEVTFDSMTPTYKDGDFVYYTRVKSTEIKENDLIVFDDKNFEKQRLFHRVIEINEYGYVTKGDAKLSNDPEIVKFEEVIGKVQDLHFPILGPYVSFINDNFEILYISLGIWILYFIISIMVIIGNMKERRKARLLAKAKKELEAQQKETPNTNENKEEKKV